MTEPTQELEALDTLIASEGWRLLMDKLQAEWGRSGTRYCDLLEKLANSPDRAQAAADMQQVIWVRKELEQFFRSFLDRQAALKGARSPQELVSSRRGVL